MNEVHEFNTINSPKEPLNMDDLIFSKYYPKDLAEKLNGGPVVADFFAVGNSTIMRINVNDGMHAVYHFEECTRVLDFNQCRSYFNTIVKADTKFVEEMAKGRGSQPPCPLLYFGRFGSYTYKVINYYFDRKEKDMKEIFKNINRKLDTYMQDEWNATIPFSEEGGELADELVALIGPGGVVNGFEVVIDEIKKGWGPNDEIKVVIFQSKDIMYHIYGEGDSHQYYATITRRYLHDHGQDYPY